MAFCTKLGKDDASFIKYRDDLKRNGLKLTSLCQVNNEIAKRKFEQEIENLKDSKPKSFQLNEKVLYHGTRAAVDKICREGLDERLSRKGRFGKGIYFSEDPIKCCKYSKRDDSYLTICKVILGDIKEYPDGTEDRGLTREPEKPKLTSAVEYFDSVKGKPREHVEYVVYEKRRVSIDFIAYYEWENEKIVPKSEGEDGDSSCCEDDDEGNSSSDEEGGEVGGEVGGGDGGNLEGYNEKGKALMVMKLFDPMVGGTKYTTLQSEFESVY